MEVMILDEVISYEFLIISWRLQLSSPTGRKSFFFFYIGGTDEENPRGGSGVFPPPPAARGAKMARCSDQTLSAAY